MHEWTMAHPYLTFTLVLFGLMLLNNLVVGLVKTSSSQQDDEEDKDQTNKVNLD